MKQIHEFRATPHLNIHKPEINYCKFDMALTDQQMRMMLYSIHTLNCRTCITNRTRIFSLPCRITTSLRIYSSSQQSGRAGSRRSAYTRAGFFPGFDN